MAILNGRVAATAKNPLAWAAVGIPLFIAVIAFVFGPDACSKAVAAPKEIEIIKADVVRVEKKIDVHLEEVKPMKDKMQAEMSMMQRDVAVIQTQMQRVEKDVDKIGENVDYLVKEAKKQ
jgi:peptidoglycan hydrolase CwlO-like protein